MNHAPNRRNFLKSMAAVSLAASGTRLFGADSVGPGPATRARLKKAVKFDMIGIDGSIKEKFELAKKVGFEGVEINSPSEIDREAAVAAQKETGIRIHGVIDSVHWKERLSDPNPEVRARGLAGLKTAIEDAGMYGASTVLLVPGRVNASSGESFDECWERSTVEVRKAIPWAREANTKIAIEVVWNDFLTRPEQLVKYVDQFNTPTVGAYFDVSNMVKYGVPPAEWIRALGPRLLKVDFKGFNMDKFKVDPKTGWVPIGEGTEDWPEVVKALDEVGYQDFVTAEVAGGGEPVLVDIAARMNKVLGLQ